MEDLQMDKHERRLLRPAVVAERCDVGVSSVRRWIRDGELPAVRLGSNGNLRVDEADLERFLHPTHD